MDYSINETAYGRLKNEECIKDIRCYVKNLRIDTPLIEAIFVDDTHRSVFDFKKEDFILECGDRIAIGVYKPILNRKVTTIYVEGKR